MAEYNFLDDITKFSSNALSAANTLQRQVRSWVNDQVEYIIRSMDLIKNEEFALQIEIRDKRLADLENKVAELQKLLPKTAATKATTAKVEDVAAAKPAAKKTTVKKAAVKKAS
jgi:BMFP domain-containing protein YqiC